MPAVASRSIAAQDRLGVGQPDIGHAVGREDDPVDAVLGERLAGQLVAEAQTGLQVRGATGLELLDDAEDLIGIGRRGRPEQDAAVVAEGDDGDRVAPIESVDQQAQGILDEFESTLPFHGPRGVDDERERRRLAGAVAHVARLQTDAQQDFVGRAERCGAAVGQDRERVVVRAPVALGKGVDPFLDAHARRIGPIAIIDIALRDRVARRVDVEGERRDLVLVRIDVRVDAWILVGHAAVGCRGRLRPRCGGGLVMTGCGWMPPGPGRWPRSKWLHRNRRPRWPARPRTGVTCA